jgi:hypothetical protein
LLVIVTCPDCVPAAVGENRSCSVNDSVGFSVIGKLPPINANPLPEITAELTVKGEVPVEVSVRAFVAEASTATLPKFRFPELIDN